MFNQRMITLRVTVTLLLLVLTASSLTAVPSPGSNDEQTLWNLEHDYWRYVQNNDLPSYTSLWHKNFLGWPGVSATPVHKDHITDWITSQTSKGLAFHLVALKPASIQVTGDVALTYYWLTAQWQAKDGTGESRTTRVTHTWVRHGKDWLIIGGMSAPEPSAP
jgi:ketosteroid isomerase-like protein